MEASSRSASLQLLDGLPLRHSTPASWARLVATDLPAFLADHGVCEQQAALFALNLVAHYPDDQPLVERMLALAAEELVHLRRVTRILHRRGLRLARRRANPYVSALQSHMRKTPYQALKLDRLLVGALIEARSCERFCCLLQVVDEPQVAALLRDLGPAERRHWELFHGLAARETGPALLAARWDAWLDLEAQVAARGGHAPTVHG